MEFVVHTSQAKQRILLAGGADPSVATNGGSVLTRRTSSASSVHDKQQQQTASAGGTPKAAALPAAFSYGLQLQENGALPPQPSAKRSASPNGSGVPRHACCLAFRPCIQAAAHTLQQLPSALIKTVIVKAAAELSSVKCVMPRCLEFLTLLC